MSVNIAIDNGSGLFSCSWPTVGIEFWLLHGHKNMHKLFHKQYKREPSQNEGIVLNLRSQPTADLTSVELSISNQVCLSITCVLGSEHCQNLGDLD